MNCPYCNVAIYREKDMKEHIDWQHWNETGYMAWLNRDLSQQFPVDEEGNPIVPPERTREDQNPDESSNLPFGPASNVEWKDGQIQFVPLKKDR